MGGRRAHNMRDEYKYQGNQEIEPDFEIGDEKYAQPEITKHQSASSDLFAPTPTSLGKRNREEDEDDDVFGDSSEYKRFKNS